MWIKFERPPFFCHMPVCVLFSSTPDHLILFHIGRTHSMSSDFNETKTERERNKQKKSQCLLCNELTVAEFNWWFEFFLSGTVTDFILIEHDFDSTGVDNTQKSQSLKITGIDDKIAILCGFSLILWSIDKYICGLCYCVVVVLFCVCLCVWRALISCVTCGVFCVHLIRVKVEYLYWLIYLP